MALWIGTYSGAGGNGLYPLDMTPKGLRPGRPAAAIGNASFGLWSERHAIAYFVDEQEAGRVTAWRPVDGEWQALSASGTGGAMPCHLGMHPRGSHLAVANYADGSVALIALDPATGLIGDLTDVKRRSGSGCDPDRQNGPHAHCVFFDESGSFLFHVDLGLDQVLRYRLAEGRLEEPDVAYAAPAGVGPRHLLLHPNGRNALLLAELSSELLLLQRNSAREFVHVETVSTLPERFDGRNLGGHLHIDQRTGDVFVSNRGHDSLVAFRLQDGRLELRGWARTGGTAPRHFWSDGKRAVVAHEEGGSVSLVPLPAGGTVSEPLCLAEVPGAAFVLALP